MDALEFILYIVLCIFRIVLLFLEFWFFCCFCVVPSPVHASALSWSRPYEWCLCSSCSGGSTPHPAAAAQRHSWAATQPDPVHHQPARGDQRDDVVHALQPVSLAICGVSALLCWQSVWCLEKSLWNGCISACAMHSIECHGSSFWSKTLETWLGRNLWASFNWNEWTMEQHSTKEHGKQKYALLWMEWIAACFMENMLLRHQWPFVKWMILWAFVLIFARLIPTISGFWYLGFPTFGWFWWKSNVMFEMYVAMDKIHRNISNLKKMIFSCLVSGTVIFWPFHLDCCVILTLHWKEEYVAFVSPQLTGFWRAQNPTSSWFW